MMIKFGKFKQIITCKQFGEENETINRLQKLHLV
jgi:hypothetical protein